MLARLQQFTTLMLLASAAAWAAYFALSGQPAWGWGGAFVILVSYALFLAAEFVLLVWVQKDTADSPAKARHLIHAWWGEVITAPRVFCWRQPFRSNAEPDSVEPIEHRGVVFVHGFVCNRGFWNPWMKKLRQRGVPFVAVNLEPLFDSIDRYVGTIEAAVKRIELATGRPPVVVAHSMGGLAVRAWLDHFQADARVHRIITVGTPHSGTWLARYAHTVNSREMALKSQWLQGLAAQSPAQRHALFTCFYSNCDNIVFPTSTATLQGADNRHVPATAHVSMAYQPVVFNEVSRWLLSPDPVLDHAEWGAARASTAR
jgi:triacylglycerol lipase